MAETIIIQVDNLSYYIYKVVDIALSKENYNYIPKRDIL